ncbi:60S ribosomal protein L10A [Paraconiothyrium brasiliense]|uniref:60S ribosomal protein L10A n=1 Tax=Paraconiothyrium brasiliense TaxID=300254 RepID=A0ABR3R5Q5_9PLEO
MAAAPSYSIVRLPKSHNHPPTWKALIAKQKALRLQSLLTSPDSFSSTYEREIAFTDADWEARLRNPSAYTLIAVKSTASRTGNQRDDERRPDSDYLDGEWIGSVVLVGPEEEHESPFATFDIYALFVLPEARGKGVGGKLIESAASEAQTLTGGASKVLIRAAVASGNERVLKLYERAGFLETDIELEEGLGVEARVLIKEIEA